MLPVFNLGRDFMARMLDKVQRKGKKKARAEDKEADEAPDRFKTRRGKPEDPTGQ